MKCTGSLLLPPILQPASLQTTMLFAAQVTSSWCGAAATAVSFPAAVRGCCQQQLLLLFILHPWWCHAAHVFAVADLLTNACSTRCAVFVVPVASTQPLHGSRHEESQWLEPAPVVAGRAAVC